MDFQQGLVCGLTGKQADFEGNCASFAPDDMQNISKPIYQKEEMEESETPTWRIALSVIIFIFIVIRLIYRLSR